VTQNMDGLHERAGSQDVVKLHGDIWLLRCTQCGREDRNGRVPMDPLPPLCRCGGILRPGMFGSARCFPQNSGSEPWKQHKKQMFLWPLGLP